MRFPLYLVVHQTCLCFVVSFARKAVARHHILRIPNGIGARRRRSVFHPLNKNPLRGGGQNVVQMDGGESGGESLPLFNNRTDVADVPSENSSSSSNHTTPMLGVLMTESSTKRQYNWREFFPRPKTYLSKGRVLAASAKSPSEKFGFMERQIKVVRWLITGSGLHAKPSESQNIQRLACLARLLILLREYERIYGGQLLAKNIGGMATQKQVLATIMQDLYSSGTPTWVLETVMGRVAEGLTGRDDVQIMLLPRRCFMYYPESDDDGEHPRRPATTDMFRISPGYDIAKLGAVEQVAVRLASFASNTRSVERLNNSWLKMPSRRQLNEVKKQALLMNQFDAGEQSLLDNPDKFAREILNLASSTYGLIFYINSPKFQQAAKAADMATTDDDFWQVSDSTRDIFSRLAAHEAETSLKRIRNQEKEPFSPLTFSLFRILSSAGACAMWFGGGWADMAVSGALAVVVANIGALFSKANFAFEERMLMEMVSSIVVGVVAGT
jgi:Putative threonine/serine exporter